MNYMNGGTVSDTVEEEFKRSKRSQIISIVFLIVIVVGVTIWRGRGVSTLKMQWTESMLTVTDPSGAAFTLDLNELQRISLREEWEYGICREGGEDRFYRYGVWENEEFGKYRLYASQSCVSVILLEASSGIIAISYESDSITRDLYESLPSMLENLGFHPEIG